MASTLPVGRRGRLVALGITALVAMVFWSAVVSPLVAFYAERAARLAERETLLRHMVQLAGEREALAARALRSGQPHAAGLPLDSSSDAVAAAMLQNLVQEMANSAGASLTSIENLPAESANGYRRVGIKVALSGTWPVLVRLLQAVEQSAQPMMIDDLRIHSQAPPIRMAQQAHDASFSIYAFARGSGTGGSP